MSDKPFHDPSTLVDRLRGNYDGRDFSNSDFIKPINLEAAKRIEELELELMDLNNELDNTYRELDTAIETIEDSGITWSDIYD